MARPINNGQFSVIKSIREVISTHHHLTLDQKEWFAKTTLAVVMEKIDDIKLIAAFVTRIFYRNITAKRSFLYNKRLERAIVAANSEDLQALFDSAKDITELIRPLKTQREKDIVMSDFNEETMIVTNAILRMKPTDKYVICPIEDISFYEKVHSMDNSWSVTASILNSGDTTEVVTVRYDKCRSEVCASTTLSGSLPNKLNGDDLILIDLFLPTSDKENSPNRTLFRKCYSYDSVVDSIATNKPLAEWSEQILKVLNERFSIDIAIRKEAWEVLSAESR